MANGTVRRIVTGFMMLAFAAGCTTTPEGVLLPAEIQEPTATYVPILVATTREPSADPAILYSGERSTSIYVNEVVVSVPPDRNRQVGKVQWPKKLRPNPAYEFAALSIRAIPDASTATRWVKDNLGPNRRLLIFVHGFNNSYGEAVFALAQIAHDSGTDATPVLFTWPSRGTIFAYPFDKESASHSRTALETLIRAAIADRGVGEVTILAHSMGTWLTVEALRQFAIRDGGIPPKISNVILASPDIDIDVFGQQIADMGPNRPQFTVFVSRDDKALLLSRRLAGNIDRLGAIDINDPRYAAALEAFDIRVFDLTALRGGDPTDHRKFADSPEVVQLLGQRLISGHISTGAATSFGDHLGNSTLGVTSAIGSVAGMVVAAPIAVFDPATRQSLGGQAEQFQRSLGGVSTGFSPGNSANIDRCLPDDRGCHIQ
ncbi:alpha/beta hydrolase [Oricola sp.]|uniref:alpha/beta hydrolase n=1 Tax=Oricola sp. TaxID=1979950 RepID=UPI003BA8D77F